MSGDPKVLAPLQQAFKETDDGRVQQQIVYAWCHETGNYNIYSLIETDIRDWTPPPAEPSLEQRVAELEAKAERHLAYLRDCIDSTDDQLKQRVDELHEMLMALTASTARNLEDLNNNVADGFIRVDRRIRAITHPDPTAPDDPVCAREGCGHKRSDHEQGIGLPRFPTNCKRCSCSSFLPAPQPAPDLDPERVEVTQENVAKALEIVGRAFHHPDTFFQYEDDRASFQFAVWVLDRIGAKFSYLKDGGA